MTMTMTFRLCVFVSLCLCVFVSLCLCVPFFVFRSSSFVFSTCLREQSYEELLTQIPVMIHLGALMIHLGAVTCS